MRSPVGVAGIECPWRTLVVRRLETWLARVEEVVQFALCLILGVPIPFLQLANHLLAVSLDLIQVVVGQLRPLDTGFALQLLPLTLQDVRVHDSVLQMDERIVRSRRTGSTRVPANPV